MPQLDQSTKDGLKILAAIIAAAAILIIGGIFFFYWLIDRDTLSLILWMD